MRLADFILTNMDEILKEWVDFARSLSGASDLDLTALQDHAEKMLRAVAAGMITDQSDAQQQVRSRGRAPRDHSLGETAAETHGDVRYAEGFTLEELILEYRALRATVIRLWTRDTAVDDRTVYELTRFNEGIDQLLAESVVHFARQLDRARQLFMGVLGHDLRTDLQVILSCAERLERSPSKEQIEKYVPHVRAGARNILAMAEDLLDVARTRLGARLPLEASRMDAARVCEDLALSFRQLHPHAEIRLELEGDAHGEWDQKRVQQMLANLLRNAFQHGDAERPITLRVERADDNVTFSVHNYGPTIPRSLLPHIFDPLQRGGELGDRTSAGLGLYIASTIAEAHGGTLTVTPSDTEGTTFTAMLPAAEGAHV